jgi:hypothetical protein
MKTISLKDAVALIPDGASLSPPAPFYVGARLITAIVNGKKPPQLTAKKLMRLALEIPVDWTAQRKLFGFHAR